MKVKRLSALLVTVLILLVFGCACKPYEEYENDESVRITVSDGAWYYPVQNTYSVRRGENVSVRLIFLGNGYPEGCSYPNAKIERVGDHIYDLTLYDVNYPAFIKVFENDGSDAIRYERNGGEFAEGVAIKGYLPGKITQNHLRTNTDLGESLSREGYILTGWNTKEDGSGAHIGLGSRVTVQRDGCLRLYAEWEKTLDESALSYELTDGKLYLTGYEKAFPDSFALPEQVDGQTVYGVRRGFFKDGAVDRLALPRSLSVVEAGAFEDVKIGRLFLFDELSEISDGSFLRCSIESVHINAAGAPRYQKEMEISYFADAIDRLILLQDSKKLVFFSGCSFAYGLNSETVQKAVGEEFEVVNIGIIGGTNAGFQLDIISRFMGKDDVLIHAPEVASRFQFMERNDAESRMFIITEGNYDLLSLVDISEIEGFFDVFASYCNNRRQMPETAYDDFSGAYNRYGDIITLRGYTGEDKAFSEQRDYTYFPSFVNERSSALLDKYYQKIRDRGALVALTYSPVNRHGLPEEDLEERVWERLEDNIIRYFAGRDVIFLSTPADYLLEGRYFYDTDYHLNDEGVKIRTERLLNDMKAHRIYGRK